MIGIFDSGVGGMTVARSIEQHCPGYPLVYFGDIARTPYGSKSIDTITRYSIRNSDLLIEQGARLIVIACNTAASIASETLRKRYKVPVIDVITPATNRAARISKSGRIGVIGTRATINSMVYERRIKEITPDSNIYSQPCPLLVPLVEEGWLSQRETKMILRKYLYPLKLKKIDTLVLGCTHYPLLKSLIQQKIGPRVTLIDSSIEAALHLKEFLDGNPEMRKTLQQPETKSRFFVSDSTPPVRNLACKIFGRHIQLEKIDV
jgi:glutamate racemase